MQKIQPEINRMVNDAMARAVQIATHQAIREAIAKIMISTFGETLSDILLEDTVKEITNSLSYELDPIIKAAFK